MKKMEDIAAHVWKIDSFDDVKRLWSSVRSVPGRTQGRKHHDYERYCLGLYLLNLGTRRLLSYPFQVEQGRQHESPDFMVTWSSEEVTGLEVTRATTPSLQRRMTVAEREYRRREAVAEASGKDPQPVILWPAGYGGVSGDEVERQFCTLLKEAITKKVEKLSGFRPASRHDLLVCDDTPLGAGDRRKIVAALNPWIRNLAASATQLGTISVIVSLDVVFDLGGSPRLLPYIEWNAPELNGVGETNDLSERIEYAGQHAATQVLQRHIEQNNPVYSMDSRGRLVKQTSDGDRLEVRVGEDGTEIIVSRLSRG